MRVQATVSFMTPRYKKKVYCVIIIMIIIICLLIEIEIVGCRGNRDKRTD